MTTKSQRWKKGAILQIDAHGYSCKGQMLEEPEIAFFDPANPDQILFRLWVHNSAYKQGRWQKIGEESVSKELALQVPRFKKDPITGKLSIYVNGNETPAELRECVDLECAAAWEPEHVEARLRDHIENRENVWVKSMALANDA
ncbi:hypothetical protein [Congregibacter sp.]|uniref:hypothetical protein n=1 Tax=Congregibacter sp. TaxID=2744308 RepID=UPI00385C6870